MGWTFPYGASKRDIIRERVAPDTSWRNDDIKWTTLAHCVRGNVLWMVKEIAYPDREPERFIECDLLEGSKDGWGYKDMEESMHPYEYSCPDSYLDMVPEVGCQEWRDIVRARNAKKHAARTVKPGDILWLKEGCSPNGPFTVISQRPLKGRLVSSGGLGNVYKIPVRMVERTEKGAR